MESIKRLAAPLGVFLVFTAMAFGQDRATDFIPVLQAEDAGKPVDPPNNGANKIITGPKSSR